jgi:DNA-binding transcriptional ArsR family regulator
METNKARDRRWTDFLSEEDLAFVKRFVLASGSLKEMAKIYGISYPTVRLRLDRLIEKVKVLDSQEITSPFERIARARYAGGQIDLETLKLLLSAHREELERHDETRSR